MEDEIIYSRCFKDRDPYSFQLDGEIEDESDLATLFRLLEYFEKFAYRNAGRFSVCRPSEGMFRLRIDARDFCLLFDEDRAFFSVVNTVCHSVRFAVHPKTNNIVLLADYRVYEYMLIDLFAKDIEAFDPQNWEDLKSVLMEILQKNKKRKKQSRGYIRLS